MAEPLRIGLLTPYTWSWPAGGNELVRGLANALAARGHQVTVIAPSDDGAAVKAAVERVQTVLDGTRATVFEADEPSPRFFFAGLGSSYRVPYHGEVRRLLQSYGFLANVDAFLAAEQIDVLHLFEPLAPGTNLTALQRVSSPLVATFHSTTELPAPSLPDRTRLQRWYDAFDVALATSRTTRDAIADQFSMAPRLLTPGVDTERFRPRVDRPDDHPLRLLCVVSSPRGSGLGVLLRALRLLEDRAPEIELSICGRDDLERRFGARVPPALAASVGFHGRTDDEQFAERLATTDIFVAPALNARAAELEILKAMAAGCAIVAADPLLGDELVRDEENALVVAPQRPRLLAAALRRLLDDRAAVAAFGRRSRELAETRSWPRVAAEVEEIYGEVAQRRRQALPLRYGRREIFADLHVHSHHSKDCVMPVAAILERARAVGLDVIAIADHDSAAGGLEARELAPEYGVRVIVGEEVKTAQGEVIGLFLNETIPGGLSFAATIAAIKAQGGIVYVPHPFDRLHTIPSPSLLRTNVADIDVVEVFNSRLAFPEFNLDAERFARRYNIPGAAGSDAHVLPGIGTALCGMDDFEGAHDFVAALAESRVIHRPRSLIYLQSLKLLQTAIVPGKRTVDSDQ